MNVEMVAEITLRYHRPIQVVMFVLTDRIAARVEKAFRHISVAEHVPGHLLFLVKAGRQFGLSSHLNQGLHVEELFLGDSECI